MEMAIGQKMKNALGALSMEEVSLLESITEQEIIDSLEEGRKDADACRQYLFNAKGGYANDNYRNQG